MISAILRSFWVSLGVLSLAGTAAKAEALEGNWEGSYTCENNEIHINFTVIGDAPTGSFEVDLYRGYERIGARQYRYTYDSFIGEVTLVPGRLVGNFRRPDEAHFSGYVDVEGSTLEGSVTSHRRACGSFSLSKVETFTVRTAPSEPEQSFSPIVKAPPVPPSVPILRARNAQDFCIALSGWGDQMLFAVPEIQNLTDFANYDREQVYNLFRDELFVPFFGKSALEISRNDWRDLDRSYDSVETKVITGKKERIKTERVRWTTTCGEMRGGWLPEYWKLAVRAERVDVQALNDAVAWRDRVIIAIGEIPATSDNVVRLDALSQEVDTRLAKLWPRDRDLVHNLLAEKHGALSNDVLADIGQRQLKEGGTLLFIEELHRLKGSSSGEIADQITTLVNESIVQWAQTQLVELPQEASSPAEVILIFTTLADVTKKLAPYNEYAGFVDVSALLDGRIQDASLILANRLQNIQPDGALAEEFYPYRDALESFPDFAEQRVLIQLWQSYYSSVDGWVQAQIVGSGASTVDGEISATPAFDPDNPLGVGAPLTFDPANPLGGSGGTLAIPSAPTDEFLSMPWSQPAIMAAVLNADNEPLYEMGVRDVLWYLGNLGGKVNQFCPNVMDMEFIKLVMDSELGYDAFNPDRDKVLEKAVNDLESFFGTVYNTPGAAIERGFEAEQEEARVEADAQLLLGSMSCQDERIRRFFSNALEFARDPSANVPVDKLRMYDLCLSERPGQPTSRPTAFTPRFCECAAPIMDTQLSGEQKDFLRIDIDGNFEVLRLLYPDYRRELSICRL